MTQPTTRPLGHDTATPACGETATVDDNPLGVPFTCARPAGHTDDIGHAMVRFPAGTPEYDEYVAALRVELGRFIAGDI